MCYTILNYANISVSNWLVDVLIGSTNIACSDQSTSRIIFFYFTVSRWSWPLILSLIQAWRTRTDAQTSGWPMQKRNPIETKTKTRLLNAWYRLCIVFTRRPEFDSGHADADASPSQLNQTNKPPHVARKLRFSEIRSGMLFITSLLVEDFRHSLIVLILLPKTMD